MKVLLNTKYIKISISLKSWGISIDWEYDKWTRPYYISFLCLHFEIGVAPVDKT